MVDVFKKKLSLLPDSPGVYLMKNASGNIIYVGKAKVLKNRVRSYFTGSHDQKTQKLVSEIADFEYILTLTEVEALLLECNLIKKYDPYYNILLKDDKSYPYILITAEKHPRILVTRKVSKKAGKYFGPYPSATAARETARLLNRLFPFRKCSQIPSKACLYFHLGQCLGPCIRDITPDNYQDVLEKSTLFLRGNQKSIIKWLEEKMTKAAAALEFEAAREYRDLISDLKLISEKQNITLNDYRNRDFVAYAFNDELISIQILCFRQGNLVTRDGFFFAYYDEPEESFISFLLQYYTNKALIPDEICIPEIKSTSVMDILPIVIPKKGKTKQLLSMAASNAETVLKEKVQLEKEKEAEQQKTVGGLAEVLGISKADTIEAFDISGLYGSNIVGGMVQFKDGKPFRSNYRKFNIAPLPDNNDDTAYLKHVIGRRYSRLLQEGLCLPDLILVDGGKGQVKAALESLHKLGLTIPIAGMVKNDRHETRTLINKAGKELAIGERTEVFRLIQRIQDEVHRFAITFHRQQRIKTMKASELDNIPGIGPKRKLMLLKAFQTFDDIKNASVDDLKNAGLNANVAEEVVDYFHPLQD
ncbi:excinuclease ABC subunit UvrC [Dehalobacter sp. DCM]|nr:excinuclease ABC subunit UvrC [Dehalobacter sp. DCM]